MTEQEWLLYPAVDSLSAPLGSWSLTGIRPRQDEDSAYEFVCCSAPVEARHADSCPQTPIWTQMVHEYGVPFHIWAFMSPGAIDVTHDDYVKRWYWFHDFPQRMVLGFDGSGGDALLQQIEPGTWEIPNPLEDMSPWMLEYYRQQRMRPVSEILGPLLEDENLKMSYSRRSQERPDPADRMGRLREMNRSMSEALRKIGVEMLVDPPKALPAPPQPQEHSPYRVSDNHDGTWRVNGINFPAEREAHWYVKARQDGRSYKGAMTYVRQRRLIDARMAHKFRAKYSWGKM